MSKAFSIFGAGAGGLYTAWRLLSGERSESGSNAVWIEQGDTLELYDWGKYRFSSQDPGSREAAGRVCTYHYKDDPNNSFVELGGMRYSAWNHDPTQEGAHRLVTTTIEMLGLEGTSVPFDVSENPLYYLRTKNIYHNDISSTNPVPYNIDHYGNAVGPDAGFSIVESIAVQQNMTRTEWCEFYQNGVINQDLEESSVFEKGERLKDIAYWNLMYDQLGSEGYDYTAAGNGYTSNVINWNSAEAMNANDEFQPGTEYKTLTGGYSSIFSRLFVAITGLCETQGVTFSYRPDTRVHSILDQDGVIHFTTATRANPDKATEERTTDFAFLAMPRAALELVAQATRYAKNDGLDVLNDEHVQLYLESAIIQPSYKIGMFFAEPWWLEGETNGATYPARLTGYVVTDAVLSELQEKGFPADDITAITKSDVFNTLYASTVAFIAAVEQAINGRLTYENQHLLLARAERNTIGPTITDTPIRQIVYFGNNAPNSKTKVYGILASYDDERFTRFWQELELGPNTERKIPLSENYQPLDGPRAAPPVMVKMLRKQLAHAHFGPQADYRKVPLPLETKFMDWSLPPFYAGYHAYAAHYDICDVQQMIRRPSQLIDRETKKSQENPQEANIFIVGETYSNDQAWVEGAFCTSESVLNDFFGIKPIIDNTNYPFICGCGKT